MEMGLLTTYRMYLRFSQFVGRAPHAIQDTTDEEEGL